LWTAQVLPLFVLLALRNRSLVVVIAACLLIFAVAGLRDKPLDVIPEFSPLSLTVKTESLGLSSAEGQSPFPVLLRADLLDGFPWLRTIQSGPVGGLSTLNVSCARGTDVVRRLIGEGPLIDSVRRATARLARRIEVLDALLEREQTRAGKVS
jgi:Cu/Ag efflux pump CusA